MNTGESSSVGGFQYGLKQYSAIEYNKSIVYFSTLRNHTIIIKIVILFSDDDKYLIFRKSL